MLRHSSLRYCAPKAVSAAGSVLLQDFPVTRLVVLNREKALNALDEKMVDDLLTVYRSTAPHQVVVLKGAGSKSFCAGGDVVSIVKNTPPGIQQSFFYKEYQMNYHILSRSHVQVALWDGIVMGGGVGVSIHGQYRVASEKALFAMPETGIGLFPDVGGSWFLPRLPLKGVGLYLALTGRRLKGADLLHAGLASHFVPSASMAALEKDLCANLAASNVADILESHREKAANIPGFSLEKDLGLLERIFDPTKSIEDMLENLRLDGSETASSLRDGLLKCSPTSLKVSLELFRRGKQIQDPKDIFVMEYHVTQRAMTHGDFISGVNALLIEKTNKPVWNPSTVEGVTKEVVDSFFDPTQCATWSPVAPLKQ